MKVYEEAKDKGLEGIVACSTKVSSIVGSTLCYKGYAIEDLVKNSSFEEVSYLLWKHELPNQKELADFSKRVRSHMKVNEELAEVLRKLPTDKIHPMAWLRSAVSLTSFWDEDVASHNLDQFSFIAEKHLGQSLYLVAFLNHVKNKTKMPEVDVSQSMSWNFLNMLHGKAPSKKEEKIIDTSLILHADHELNCSSFSARVTCSSLSDVTSALVSAIGTLKGPLHGGANEQVMLMLKEIASKDKVSDYVESAFREKRKIMGFGHRVYKDYDPRMKVLKDISKELTKEKGMYHFYEMSEMMEKMIDEKKGLHPNVDFYSASVYYALGIPAELYTPIFVASRMSGWLAHILEQYSQNRIYRPRASWVGKSGLKYKAVEKRD